MTNLETLLIIAGVSLGIGGALFLLFPYLKKIGVNVEDLIKKTEIVLNGADQIATVASEIDPRAKILKVVLDEAIKGVNSAEQLYISSQIPSGQRKEKATELITAALRVAGIDITDDVKTVIDGYIDDVIFVAKTPEEQKSQQQNVLTQQINTLQAQLTQTTNSNTTLTQENVQLKQKLTAIQSSVAQNVPVQQ